MYPCTTEAFDRLRFNQKIVITIGNNKFQAIRYPDAIKVLDGKQREMLKSAGVEGASLNRLSDYVPTIATISPILTTAGAVFEVTR